MEAPGEIYNHANTQMKTQNVYYTNECSLLFRFMLKSGLLLKTGSNFALKLYNLPEMEITKSSDLLPGPQPAKKAGHNLRIIRTDLVQHSPCADFGRSGWHWQRASAKIQINFLLSTATII